MSKEVLSRHWGEFLHKANALNVALGTKWKDGKDTGLPAIVVYVHKKVPNSTLAQEDIIPDNIEGVPTDVVEMTPDTWNADKTSISRLHPEEQRWRLGLIQRPTPKMLRLAHRNLKAPNGQSNLISWASLIQDQGPCGACPSFGSVGVAEACFRIKGKSGKAPFKLSEAHLFFCSGGTCNGGNTVEAVLNQFMKGVCIEKCLPYKPQDQSCEAGICKNWWLNAKKLASWNDVTDPTEIKALLDTVPLNAAMAVHQSFFNYAGGIYKNLGPQDPVVGYHDIGCFGYSDAQGVHIIRNSWGTGWGHKCNINKVARPGYCLIAYGELDPEMQELIPDGTVPAPPPPPKPPKRRCWFLGR